MFVYYLYVYPFAYLFSNRQKEIALALLACGGFAFSDLNTWRLLAKLSLMLLFHYPSIQLPKCFPFLGSKRERKKEKEIVSAIL